MNGALRIPALIVFMVAVASSFSPAADGNSLLRESERLHPLPNTYSAPMSFRVHVQRPIRFAAGASAIVYFKSPDKQALVITSLPRVIARSIARSYNNIDTVTAKWPGEYRARGVSSIDFHGEPAYQIDAVPVRHGDVTQVHFYLLRRDLSAVGAQWVFRDGSLVGLTVHNRSVGKYLLPAREEISVAMPRIALDAEGESGSYAIDAPIPDGIF